MQIDPRLTSGVKDVAGDIGAAFAAFQDKGKKHRNTAPTEALVRTMNASFGSPINTALLTKLGTTPRSIWTPTTGNFFKACRAELLDSIWRKLACASEGGNQMERFAKLKVGEKRTELEALFANASTQEALGLSRDQVATIDAWLPDEIGQFQD